MSNSDQSLAPSPQPLFDLAPGPPSSDPQPHASPGRVVLLDLAGDAARARAWAETLVPGAPVLALDKAELKAGSKREALAELRRGGPHALFAIYCNRLDMQPGRALMMLFGWIAGARRVCIGDMEGRSVERSAAGIFLAELPWFFVELALAYGVVVPLAWVMVVALRAASRLRPRPALTAPDGPVEFLYLRATPAAGAMVGGSTSHIAGMVGGLAELGHRVRFIANDVLPGIDASVTPVEVIASSPRFGTQRALFEVWNAFVFAAGAFGRARRARADVLYQRYSRFNWTGALLALLLRKPFFLEFNGSEVWVAENWDPVGQRGLLAAVERLNLLAADRVFVVSEVLGRDCERAGVDRSRVVVNPNGVDPDRFRPHAGGDAVRARLGLEGRTVAGFVGTFGPWHGVVALAEAIARLAREAGPDVVFLLVGDGDQRPRVERILEESGARDRVIFTGRVAHDEVPAYLDACDILLSPHVEMPDGSDFFGSPTKLFEYMAMGKAVAASRLGQIEDVIEDGVTGLLLPPGDVEALAGAIGRLASDADLRARLGIAAREAVVREYTWLRNAERVIESFGR